MKIDTYIKQEQYYKDKAEEVRIEMSKAIKERDRIYEEIKEQRRGNNEVSKDLSKKQTEKESLLFLLEILNQDFEKNKTLFYNLTDKQKEILDKINSEINNKEIINKNLSEEINKNSSINIDIKNKKEEKKELVREIEQLTNFKTDLEIENDLLEQNNKQFIEKLKQQEIDNKKLNKELKEKERKLNIKEKRLEGFEKDLFSKK